jgi:hypothetical protein
MLCVFSFCISDTQSAATLYPLIISFSSAENSSDSSAYRTCELFLLSFFPIAKTTPQKSDRKALCGVAQNISFLL